jgi:hypothetical protein
MHPLQRRVVGQSHKQTILFFLYLQESTAVANSSKRVRDEARHKQPQAGDSTDGAEGRKKLLNASTRHLVYYEVTRTKIGERWTQS